MTVRRLKARSSDDQFMGVLSPVMTWGEELIEAPLTRVGRLASTTTPTNALADTIVSGAEGTGLPSRGFGSFVGRFAW